MKKNKFKKPVNRKPIPKQEIQRLFDESNAKVPTKQPAKFDKVQAKKQAPKPKAKRRDIDRATAIQDALTIAKAMGVAFVILFLMAVLIGGVQW